MYLQQVTDFHNSFETHTNQPLEGGKTDNKLLEFRQKLIAEEFVELMDEYKSLATAVYNRSGKVNVTKVKEKYLKELCDLIYVLVGTAVTFGWDLDEAFKRVHESNMSKLGPDGKPLRREDGKVIKSENYVEPILTDLVG